MKYTIAEGIVFKFENEEVKSLDRTYLPINRYFIVPEDGEVDGVPVNKGDVICTLYREEEPRFIIITDSNAKKLALEEFYRRNKPAEKDSPCPNCEAAA